MVKLLATLGLGPAAGDLLFAKHLALYRPQRKSFASVTPENGESARKRSEVGFKITPASRVERSRIGDKIADALSVEK
jgi:hypothetical protein